MQPQPSPLGSDEVLTLEAGREAASDGEEEAQLNSLLGARSPSRCPDVDLGSIHPISQPRLKPCSLLGLLWEPGKGGFVPAHPARVTRRGWHRTLTVLSLLLLHSPACHNISLANLSRVGAGMEMDACNGMC